MQHGDGRRRPWVYFDRFHIFFGINKTTGKAELWWEDGMSNAEALRWLDRLYIQMREHLIATSQPQPPRERPSPHYRPLPNTLADPATYDRD